MTKLLFFISLISVFPIIAFGDDGGKRYERKLFNLLDLRLSDHLIQNEINENEFQIPSKGSERESIALDLFRSEDDDEAFFKKYESYKINSEDLKHRYPPKQETISDLQAKMVLHKIEKLRATRTSRKKVFLDFTQLFVHDSNITQLPDGTTSVSGKDGMHSDTKLNLKSESRDLYWLGKLAAKAQFGDTRYFDNAFEARDSRFFALNIEQSKHYRSGPLMMHSIKLGYRNDFLRSGTEIKHAFDALTLGTNFIFKPIKKMNRFSDQLIPFLIVGLEDREYGSQDEFDTSGLNKYTWTPSLTALCLNIKNKDKYRERSIVYLDTRKFNSDSNELDYLNFRLGLSYTRIYAKIDATLEAAFAYRDQSDYQNQSRRDDAAEIGLNVQRKFLADRLKLSARVLQTKQSSSQNLFSYSNTRFSLGMICEL